MTPSSILLFVCISIFACLTLIFSGYFLKRLQKKKNSPKVYVMDSLIMGTKAEQVITKAETTFSYNAKAK